MVTPQRIMEMAWAYAPPLVIEAAVRNGVFDQLDAAPKTVEETAASTGASVRGLRVIMNALVGIGLLARDAGGKYSLTPESSAYMVSSRQGYVGGFFRHTSTQILPEWLELSDIVKAGRSMIGVNEEKKGVEFFREFVEDLFPLNYPITQALATELKLDGAQAPVRVLDIAAGSGVWGIGLAQRSKQVWVTALDWEGVLEITRKVAERHGVAGRFTFLAGDLRSTDFGAGYQLATLGHILHSEGEARSRDLLKKVFAALAPGGTIAIQEFLVNAERTGPPVGLFFAVNMLVATTDGDTWSFEEISGWLKEAGFDKMRTLDSPGPSPLILANKPE
jgi:ubiquinone/menaquinone biosynthesis C-methylase UbiE